MVIDDGELKLAAQGAKSAWRSSRNLIDYNDLLGEAHLWLVENYSKLEEWREEGRHGKNKIRIACRQKCLSVVARERKRRSGLQHGDAFYYTLQMIREVLPNVWDPDDWQTSQQVLTGDARTPSRPSEGNNRLAMIVDIRGALFNLPEIDQQLLSGMYKDGGTPLDVVATQWEVTERTIRRREERILDKMVERLGGEPPWRR